MTDARLSELLNAWRRAGNDADERTERERQIREYLAPVEKIPDPDREAVSRAAAVFDTDPAEAERLLREHFALEPTRAPAVEPSGRWRKERDPPPVLWRDADGPYCDSVAAAGEVAVLAGAGKGGKSYLTVALAVEAARARRESHEYGKACGLRVRAGPVVLMSFEDSPKRIDMRADAMGAGVDGVPILPNPEPIYGHDPNTRRWDALPAWRATWAAIHAANPVLVVVDTGPKAMGGETNDPGAVIGFLQKLEREARAGGFAVLVTAHDTKAARAAVAAGGKVEDAVAGSGQWHDSPRGVLHLAKTGPGDAARILEAVKCSYGRDGWGAKLKVRYEGERYAGLELAERLDEAGIAAAREALKPASSGNGRSARKSRGNAAADRAAGERETPFD